MNMINIWAVYFSPTGGTKELTVHIAEAAAKAVAEAVLENLGTVPAMLHRNNFIAI